VKALILLILISGCSVTFTKKANKLVLVESAAMISCDIGQTLWMNHDNKWDRGLTEMNPLQGRTPSQTRIVIGGLLWVGGNVLADKILSPKMAFVYLALTAVVETANVLTQPQGHIDRRGFCGL
jgi:hypothetical protein